MDIDAPVMKRYDLRATLTELMHRHLNYKTHEDILARKASRCSAGGGDRFEAVGAVAGVPHH